MLVQLSVCFQSTKKRCVVFYINVKRSKLNKSLYGMIARWRYQTLISIARKIFLNVPSFHTGSSCSHINFNMSQQEVYYFHHHFSQKHYYVWSDPSHRSVNLRRFTDSDGKVDTVWKLQSSSSMFWKLQCSMRLNASPQKNDNTEGQRWNGNKK